ncbi:MAG TPA: alpha/beta hydrolase [Natronosporangium sp.]
MPYADVNGLSMYYEVHGEGELPLVLIHGAFSGIGTSFGELLPGLAERHRVIAVELQGHGRTADIDRPFGYDIWADDIAALLAQLDVARVDVFGYSFGSAVAVELGLRHPALVRKLVVGSCAFFLEGLQPGLMDGLEDFKAEHLQGTPFWDEYQRIAPDPSALPTVVEKKNALDRAFKGWTAEQITGMGKPFLLIAGDSDIVKPEHEVEMFRLLGGGVIGDLVGLPDSQLAILPGTTHITLVQKAEWLVSMISQFLSK